jgi:hypothetical protein
VTGPATVTYGAGRFRVVNDEPAEIVVLHSSPRRHRATRSGGTPDAPTHNGPALVPGGRPYSLGNIKRSATWRGMAERFYVGCQLRFPYPADFDSSRHSGS